MAAEDIEGEKERKMAPFVSWANSTRWDTLVNRSQVILLKQQFGHIYNFAIRVLEIQVALQIRGWK